MLTRIHTVVILRSAATRNLLCCQRRQTAVSLALSLLGMTESYLTTMLTILPGT